MKTVTMDYETYLKEKNEKSNDFTLHGIWIATQILKGNQKCISPQIKDSVEYQFYIQALEELLNTPK